MQLVLASRNPRKASELRQLLSGLPVVIRTLDEFPGAPEVVEDGLTFADNARKKALAASKATGLAALADDSGLEVDFLGGAPGVLSARYAGEGGGDEANNRKLLAALRGVPLERRTARFRCVIALAWPVGEVDLVEGSCGGIILEEARGRGGFGYDPVFFYPPLGRSFAELTPEEKHQVSHRGEAFRAAAALIRRRISSGSP